MENEKKLITREEYNQMLNRIVELSDQVNRLFEVLKDYEKGREFTLAFNENVYLELAEIRRSARCNIVTTMELLLKLKYCSNNHNHNDWRMEVITAQRAFIDVTEIISRTPNTIVIDEIKKSMDDLYYYARNRYIDTAEQYSDLEDSGRLKFLKDGLKYLPETCPWTFEEVIYDRIDELVSKLPDPDELTVHMQLSTICKYLDIFTNKLDSKIIGKQCSECENYQQCISDYHKGK